MARAKKTETTKKAAPKKRSYASKKKNSEPVVKMGMSLVKSLRDEDYLNAFKHGDRPIVSSTSLASFTNLCALAKVYPLLSNAYDTIVICVPSLYHEFQLFSWRTDNGTYLGGVNYPVLNLNPPNTAKVQRFTVELANSTTADSIESVCNICRGNTGLKWDFATADNTNLNISTDMATSIVDQCTKSPDCSQITNKKLADSTVSWNSYPISMNEYDKYKDFGTYTGTQPLLDIKTALIATENNSSMAPIMFHFPANTSVATIQKIQFAIKTQFSLKYPENHIVNHVAKTTHPPDRTGMFMDAHRDEVKKGSDGKPYKKSE